MYSMTFVGRGAAVVRLDGHRVDADRLPVEEPVDDQVEHQRAVLVPLGGQPGSKTIINGTPCTALCAR